MGSTVSFSSLVPRLLVLKHDQKMMANSQPHPRPRIQSGDLTGATESLVPFQLAGVRNTGIKVGDGSYATVKELDFCGLKCVGKKIHTLMYQLANDQEREEILERFTSECELLSRLHHPCIVQFLGVYYEEDSELPVMVMEYLYTTLASCLGRYGVLPEEITYSILRDVALGLRYLHERSPPVVHRDLSANNILLTRDMNAKISDLGVAKILNLSPAQITQRISTQAPGTPCYMPPEALVAQPSYTSKIDSYSYGVLIIHVLCGKWPFPSEAFVESPDAPGSFLPVNEFDRRKEHLAKIGSTPLLVLIQQCLSNTPASRPEVLEILVQIENVRAKFPAPFENKVEMIKRIQSQEKDTEVGKLKKEIEAQKKEFDMRKNEMESKLLECEAQKQKSEAETELHRKENEAQRREIETLKKHNEAHREVIEAKAREIESQKEEILSLSEQLETLSIPLPTPSTVEQASSQIHPHTPLQWKKCADLPVGMVQHSAVLIKGIVYVGGGYASHSGAPSPEDYLVFQYDESGDSWDALPPCPVRLFTLIGFDGDLVALGGTNRQGVATNKVYRYRDESRKWEEHLKPMLTARFGMAVATRKTAIITCGGGIGPRKNFANVEVYTTESGKWQNSEFLPDCYGDMTCITMGDTCYLLGGVDKSEAATKSVFFARIGSLVGRAIQPQEDIKGATRRSAWRTLPDVPLAHSTAASLKGRLLSIGGRGMFRRSSAVYMFVATRNSWIRMPSGDLPTGLEAAAAIELPDGKLLVCGGWSDRNATYVGRALSG